MRPSRYPSICQVPESEDKTAKKSENGESPQDSSPVDKRTAGHSSRRSVSFLLTRALPLNQWISRPECFTSLGGSIVCLLMIDRRLSSRSAKAEVRHRWLPNDPPAGN